MGERHARAPSFIAAAACASPARWSRATRRRAPSSCSCRTRPRSACTPGARCPGGGGRRQVLTTEVTLALLGAVGRAAEGARAAGRLRPAVQPRRPAPRDVSLGVHARRRVAAVRARRPAHRLRRTDRRAGRPTCARRTRSASTRRSATGRWRFPTARPGAGGRRARGARRARPRGRPGRPRRSGGDRRWTSAPRWPPIGSASRAPRDRAGGDRLPACGAARAGAAAIRGKDRPGRGAALAGVRTRAAAAGRGARARRHPGVGGRRVRRRRAAERDGGARVIFPTAADFAGLMRYVEASGAPRSRWSTRPATTWRSRCAAAESTPTRWDRRDRSSFSPPELARRRRGVCGPPRRRHVLNFRSMFNLGMGEITVILLLALIFVGPKKLPDLATGLGKLIRQIRKTTADVKNEIVLDDTFRKPFEELRDAVTLAGRGAQTPATIIEAASANRPRSWSARSPPASRPNDGAATRRPPNRSPPRRRPPGRRRRTAARPPRRRRSRRRSSPPIGTFPRSPTPVAASARAAGRPAARHAAVLQPRRQERERDPDADRGRFAAGKKGAPPPLPPPLPGVAAGSPPIKKA